MTFLPIVARELKVASRRNSTYWIRCGAAGLLILIGAWTYFVMWRDSSNEVASALFCVVTGAAVLVGLISGPRLTADALSSEKRDGTLGLLFLTDLKGYDVVLGKLAGHSVNSVYGMLALLPVTAVPLLLGGITLAEFGRTAIVAVNTLFFSLSLGLLASAFTRLPRRSVSLSILILLVLAVIVPGIGIYLNIGIMRWRSLPPLFWPSPIYGYVMAFESQYRTMPGQYWGSLIVVNLLGWICLVIASLVVPHTWQDKPAGAQRGRLRDWWRAWILGGQNYRAKLRARLLDCNPFMWLASRVVLKPVYPWLALAVAFIIWVGCYLKFRADWLNPAQYFITGAVLCLIMKGWIASEASKQLAEERQHGTLELLLVTPLTVQDIVHGQWLALLRQFMAPLITVLTISFVLMAATLHEVEFSNDRSTWGFIWVGMIVMLVADAFALYWVGMWDGLNARNPNHAANNSLARILVLPWACLAILLMLVVMASAGDGPQMGFWLLAWLVIGISNDFAFGIWAQRKLFAEFRRAAASKYDPRPGVIARLLRLFKGSGETGH